MFVYAEITEIIVVKSGRFVVRQHFQLKQDLHLL